MSTTDLAIVVFAFLADHLAFWSLFWARGWRITVVTPKPAGASQDFAVPVAGENPAAGRRDSETPAVPTISTWKTGT